MTSQAAKEYLVSEIAKEAELQGQPLTENERLLLFYSETHWAPEESLNASAFFDDEPSIDAYEKRMMGLVRDHLQRPDIDHQMWNDAAHQLMREDHYILVIIEFANASPVAPG